MIDWIFNNKEWLFSGAGITILAALIRYLLKKGLFQRILLRLAKTPITPITPEQINEAVDYVPALRKADIFRHYLGLRVNWFATLASVQRLPEDHKYVHLQLRCQGVSTAQETSLFCAVRFSHYPDLIRLRDGSPIRVIGRIHKIEEAGITLRDVELIVGQWTTP